MRRILILTFSAALLIWLPLTAVSAAPTIGFDHRGELGSRDIVRVGSRYGQGCCTAPPVYSYPSNLPTYTMSGPYYFNPNLYYYRNYYPYPWPNTPRARNRWRGRGIILEQ